MATGKVGLLSGLGGSAPEEDALFFAEAPLARHFNVGPHPEGEAKEAPVSGQVEGAAPVESGEAALAEQGTPPENVEEGTGTAQPETEPVAEQVEVVAEAAPAKLAAGVEAALGEMQRGLGGLGAAETLAQLIRRPEPESKPLREEVLGKEPGPVAGGGAMVGHPAASAAGGVLGQIISAPFVALRRVFDVLDERLENHRAVASGVTADVGRGSLASHAVPDHVLAMGEPITSWKMAQIRTAAAKVKSCSGALKETDAYQVFEQAVRDASDALSMPKEQVISAMRVADGTIPMLDVVKERARALRDAYPQLAEDFQKASDDLMRHAANVKEKVIHSTDEAQITLSEVLQSAADQSAGLPGFGSGEEGEAEFAETLAERIKALIELITQFIEKLTGILIGRHAPGSTASGPSPS